MTDKELLEVLARREWGNIDQQNAALAELELRLAAKAETQYMILVTDYDDTPTVWYNGGNAFLWGQLENEVKEICSHYHHRSTKAQRKEYVLQRKWLIDDIVFKIVAVQPKKVSQ